jgi:hypothetical protein
MDWLQQISDRLAERCALDASSLAAAPDARRALLDVARTASHSTGNRTNAPLLCYVLGRATAQGASLDEMIAIVNETAAAPGAAARADEV